MNIPHNEQKHNNNQLSLQNIGNLSYHRGKIATSYDSVNTLTTPNNHYTLLYPDLVQELFNFSLHNNNSLVDNAPFLRNISVNNTKYSSLDLAISSSLNSLLSPRDILFFLQIVSLYQLELSKGNTSITYPSLKLAKILGVDASCDTSHSSNILASSCSSNSLRDANMRATILKMTAKLESLGLLKVFRRKRKNGMDKANTLIPVLPDKLYARIKDSPANLKVNDSSKLEHESNLEHILRTKLFVPIELEFMKSLFKNNLPSKYKLFFLNCIMSAYRNFRYNSSGSNMLSFAATSSELIQKNNISKRTLFNIFKYIKQQGDSFYLKVKHKYTKSDDLDSNRYDKSIFVISINPLVFPISQKGRSQEKEIFNSNYENLNNSNYSFFPDTYKYLKEGVQKKQPISAKKTALNNKDIITKNKDIDYIDINYLNFKNSSVDNSQDELREPPTTKNTEINHQEEFWEDKHSLSSSESYNNSSFLNDSCKRTCLRQTEKQEETTVKSKNKEAYKELRHFYPLSEKDVSTLNLKANREFSDNFVNQLLLKLYIKYPEKRFKNRFTFLSYMVQILENEKHQGPLVNHISFRFSCNIGTEEKNLLEYEKYLSEIENSFDTSKEMCVKKKIAGRFSSEVAYKIITGVEFKKNQDDSFVTVFIPSRLDLSEQQIEILSEQLESVYGINGYYVQEELEDVGYAEKDRRGIDTKVESTEDKTSSTEDRKVGIQIFSKIQIGVPLSAISSTTAWHKIRKGLIEELGEAIDTVWFSKAKAVECNDTKTLTLTMPTKFMADWIKNNYYHIIRRLASSAGIKNVEYVKM